MIIDAELKAAIRELAEYSLIENENAAYKVAINRVILEARKCDKWFKIIEGLQR